MPRLVFVHGVFNHTNPFPDWARTLGIAPGEYGEVFWGDLFRHEHDERSPALHVALSTAGSGDDPARLVEDDAGLPLPETDEGTLRDLMRAMTASVAPEATGAADPYAVPPLSIQGSGAAWSYWVRAINLGLREVLYYLRNEDHRGVRVRDTIRARFDAAFRAGDVVVAHSMGSVIAYDCLCRHNDATAPKAGALVTFGSPLGLDFLRAALPVAHHGNREKLVHPRRLGGRWLNAFDPRDWIVRLESFDPRDRPVTLGLMGEFEGGDPPGFSESHCVIDAPPHHDALEYLAQLRDAWSSE